MKGDGVEEGGVKEEGAGGSAVPPEPPPSQLSPCQAHSCLPPSSLSDSSQLNFMAGTSPLRLPVWSTMPFFFSLNCRVESTRWGFFLLLSVPLNLPLSHSNNAARLHSFWVCVSALPRTKNSFSVHGSTREAPPALPSPTRTQSSISSA